jgi:subtilisin family serine protease
LKNIFRLFILGSILAPPLNAAAADFKAGEILVRWKADPSAAALDQAALNMGLPAGLPAERVREMQRGRWQASLKRRLPQLQVETWTLSAGQAVTALARVLNTHPLIDYAEPNYTFKAYAAGPPDELLPAQWYYSQIKADLAYDAFIAGDILLPATVTVAVLDTGLAPHDQLTTQVDTANAISFYPGVGETYDKDDSGHGTFVSGLIGATTGDGGMAGVYFNTGNLKILPVKVLGGVNGTGDLDDIAEGIVYAINRGARIINMSLGADFSALTLENAVNLAVNSGILVVAATGNGNGPVGFPARYANVLAVGALTNLNGRAHYSNYGNVDISAPGGNDDVDCVCFPSGSPHACAGSEVISLAAQTAAVCGSPNNYTGGPGTSFATPMVAAAAALLLSQNISRTPSDLVRILTQSADATAHGSGYNTQVGWGRLNIYRALTGQAYHVEQQGKAIKLYNWPNPFNPRRQGITTFSFVLDAPAPVRLSLYDQGGDRVLQRDIGQSDTVAGLNASPWDGRNQRGDMVANGSYLLVLESGGTRVKHWVAVLR